MVINSTRNGCTCANGLLLKNGLCYNITSQQLFYTPGTAVKYFDGAVNAITARESLSFVPLQQQVVINGNNNQSAVVTVGTNGAQMPIVGPNLPQIYPASPPQPYPSNTPTQINPSVPIQSSPITPIPIPLLP
jgi:hypothetical protein